MHVEKFLFHSAYCKVRIAEGLLQSGYQKVNVVIVMNLCGWAHLEGSWWSIAQQPTIPGPTKKYSTSGMLLFYNSVKLSIQQNSNFLVFNYAKPNFSDNLALVLSNSAKFNLSYKLMHLLLQPHQIGRERMWSHVPIWIQIQMAVQFQILLSTILGSDLGSGFSSCSNVCSALV